MEGTSEAVFANELAELYWVPASRCVHVEWKGFAHPGPFQEVLEQGLELIREHGAPFWLADTARLSVLSGEQQAWTNDVWFPKALEYGLRRMALILPETTIAKMSFEEVLERMGSRRFARRYFASVKEAYAWLHREAEFLGG